MTGRKMFKKHGDIVGVITTLHELRLAGGMTSPPDLFEIRLDHLINVVDELEARLPELRRPLIITARHPGEGGANNLSVAHRRKLLLRFVPHAQYLDIELRSIKGLRTVVSAAQDRKVKRILSFHDFATMPGRRSLHTKALAAKRFGADIFKIAVRTDTPAQLARLVDFTVSNTVEIGLSVMGIGKLGSQSRLELAPYSALAYAAIGRPKVAGQLSVGQLRARIADRRS